jgi:sigma-B regulation protein RsbU (phosphoserine phosphatase)
LAVGLANTRLIEGNERRRRMEQDLNTARSIQLGLLPRCGIRRSDIIVEGLNEPGAGVSGDYYDFIELPGGCVAVVIADVSGKGIPASLLMASLHGAARTTLPRFDNLAEVVASWNDLICAHTSTDKYITAVVAVVDPSTRRVRYVLAGHEPPYWLAAGHPPTRLPAPGGYPLGVAPDERYEVFEHHVADSSGTMVFYTDGVSEAFNPEMETFGQRRLEVLLGEKAALAPAELLKACREGIRRFASSAPQSDDITLVAIHLPD